MAADILCRLLPRLPGKLVKLICERVSVTRDPPAPLLSSLLTHGEPTLIAALLESAAIGDLELERVVASGDLKRIRLIARRRVLPQGLVAGWWQARIRRFCSRSCATPVRSFRSRSSGHWLRRQGPTRCCRRRS